MFDGKGFLKDVLKELGFIGVCFAGVAGVAYLVWRALVG